VRNRIDGVLITVREIPMNLAAAVVSRIKILSSLDIAQRRVPQDGRFDINIDGQDIDIRVSVIPTIHGESIVLRLLYKKAMSFDFDRLGYSTTNKHRILRMLDKPHGLILVTGPTGSGKSTTMYAMLQQINSSEKKIVSVEDPVEYKVEGVNQIQVNPEIGVSFSNALSAIVRHDPEVIMVGEMRDSETAQIAVRASMTGHLILTTLHTNSAASSIDRLIDLGIDKTFVYSALIGVIAQRLVRRLCDHCKRPVVTDSLTLDSFEVDVAASAAMHVCEPVGCEHCNHTGYRGRLSICEVMMVNDDFRAEALKNGGNIQNLARRYGMQSMVVDGFDKVATGLTSIEELYRVVLE
jgi:general secretion pathway protein E